jgi:hypothetical protein
MKLFRRLILSYRKYVIPLINIVQNGPNLKIDAKKTIDVTESVEPPVGSSIERKNEIKLRRNMTPKLIRNLSRLMSVGKRK